MKLKIKAALSAPRMKYWQLRANKHGRKYTKFPESEKFGIAWRHSFVLKKAIKTIKALNIELEVIGYDNLPKAPAILAPNHASILDPILMVAALKNPDQSPDASDGIPLFLAKDDIGKNKKTKGYAALIDTYFIDRNKPREAIEQLDLMAEFGKVNKRYSIIFPEGTRSKDGTIHDFKGGAFRSAKKSFTPIVPVTINNAPAAADMERTEKLKVQIIFHPQIKPMSFISQDTKDIAINVKKIVEKSWVKPQATTSSIEKKV